MHPVATMKPSALPNAANSTQAGPAPANGGSFDLLMALSLALDQFVATPGNPSNEINENAEIISLATPAKPASFVSPSTIDLPNTPVAADEPPENHDLEADALALLIAGSPLAPLFQQTVAVDVTQPMTDLKTPKPLIQPEILASAVESPQKIVVPIQPDQTWNLRDLAWQLRAALRQVTQDYALPGSGPAPAQPGLRPSPLARPVAFKNRIAINGTPQSAAPEKVADPRFMPSPEAHLHRVLAAELEYSKPIDLTDLKLEAPAKQQIELPELALPASQPTPQPAPPKTEIIMIDPTATASFSEQLLEVAELIADRAQGAIRVGDKGIEATMRLYPPDLGNVRVALHVQHDSTVQAQFIAERPETAALIQKHLPQLQESFARQGLVVERIQVSAPVSAPAPSSDSSAFNNQQHHDPRRHNFWQDQRRPQDQRPQGSAFEDFLG